MIDRRQIKHFICLTILGTKSLLVVNHRLALFVMFAKKYFPLDQCCYIQRVRFHTYGIPVLQGTYLITRSDCTNTLVNVFIYEIRIQFLI